MPVRTQLIGLTRTELACRLAALGIDDRKLSMRVAQIWRWIYRQGVTGFSQMHTLGRSLRAQLADHFAILRPETILRQVSDDGTVKWLFRFQGAQGAPPVDVETVYIPEPGRGTLCLSSQVGCTLNCRFCHTGTQRLVRNLSAGEIVAQLLAAREQLAPAEGPQGGETRPITNIVMMGMGEPLYNFDAVRDALLIASDGDGIALSKRRITLSTSGVVPMIPATGTQIGCLLAISLHAVRDDLRDALVPINRKWPIAELLDACRNYPGLSNARRITFEYVMLDGVNDSPADARELVRLLRGIPAKVNLIPFNPWPGAPFTCPPEARIEAFGDIVNRAGYASPVRRPRGQDIQAACGQLKSASVPRARKAGARGGPLPSSQAMATMTGGTGPPLPLPLAEQPARQGLVSAGPERRES